MNPLKKTFMILLIPGIFSCSKTDDLFESQIPLENKTYDSSSITDLPEPVQRYFNYALTDGQDYVNSLRLKHSGTFKTAKDRDWMDIKGEQYFIVNPPGFIWIGKTNAFTAIDKYIGGEGDLSVYLFGLVRIVKENGTEINQAELLRWLGESVWMPTNLLPAENKTWEAIDENSARLNFTYKDLNVYYIVTFDETGRITCLETERYLEDKLTGWKGEVSNYTMHDGMMVPEDIEASWMLEDGKYTYARFHVEEFEFNKAEKF